MVMYKSFLGGICLLLAPVGVAIASQVVTIFGDKSYPPYSYIEDGEAKGIYVEVFREAFERMPDYSVNFKMIPWRRMVKGVKSGEYVAFFPPYYSDERTSWINYSTPILAEQVVVFGKKEKLLDKVKWPEDFYGSTIGLNNGYGIEVMGGKVFLQATQNGTITLKHAGDNVTNLKMLEKNRIDFYINDKLTDISQYEGLAKGVVAADNFSYLGFTKKTENFPFLPDLITKFNAVIEQMKSEGFIKNMANKYTKEYL